MKLFRFECSDNDQIRLWPALCISLFGTPDGLQFQGISIPVTTLIFTASRAKLKIVECCRVYDRGPDG